MSELKRLCPVCGAANPMDRFSCHARCDDAVGSSRAFKRKAAYVVEARCCRARRERDGPGFEGGAAIGD